ncbi:dTDP-4-dehydrorhamnose 3,5-epimerase [Raineyella antarctica]|uniref:dTDP-4-dehydrorhamnose 3,5-epimerase n=1 Tax=Raineyella antarctica TaxID=1577474 RepID=A0A1G6GDR2_9ACTN|nr:bifunctional dTDP-4-dehydrorhamnose 3,5-epimerase family protein/NAD(P)-dependent oxidoreductase [Raineyella antarctica]SDB79875.1 dTDP-4-dehydrorhamnose 3,5-epimerase [Raineyella antarctica]
MGELTVKRTAIPGLLVLDLPLHGDARGWFKENWQREKMTALGLPDFGPVQNNVSFNPQVGVARGIHAEPWDKLVSVATGRVFGAWVDLRAGDSFGRVVTVELGPDTAVFVPRGVANCYQTLEPDTAYSYLVNDHWSPEAKASYTFVNLADPQLGIDWPIPLEQAEVSEADRNHPMLADVVPMAPRRTVIVGANGQLGRALRLLYPDAIALARPGFDLSRPDDLTRIRWADVETIINASAFTAVDAAETPEGRRTAWATNVEAVARLARIATEHRITLVQMSSDYVFDGTADLHTEDEPFSPLGVYGQTKAAGDAIVSTVPRHYIVRTSWVIGDGKNFVATMAMLADKGVRPTVVDDQYGRLTFTDDLARAIRHLVGTDAAYGVYNVTGDGPVQSWADIAADVYGLKGHDRAEVTPVSAQEYGRGKDLAPRPVHSALALDKIKATGFRPAAVDESLRTYVADLPIGS